MIKPQSSTIEPPPRTCEAFQNDILVASSRGANQWVNNLAQGGYPIPWNQPLSIQNNAKNASEELAPKQTLIAAHANSARAMKTRAFARSASMPLRNFET